MASQVFCDPVPIVWLCCEHVGYSSNPHTEVHNWIALHPRKVEKRNIILSKFNFFHNLLLVRLTSHHFIICPLLIFFLSICINYDILSQLFWKKKKKRCKILVSLNLLLLFRGLLCEVCYSFLGRIFWLVQDVQPNNELGYRKDFVYILWITCLGIDYGRLIK